MVVGGLVLFLGLALLMLRRRNDVLQIFLTPEEPGLEEEFFGVRHVKQKKSPSDDISADPEEDKSVNVADEGTVHWGALANDY